MRQRGRLTTGERVHLHTRFPRTLCRSCSYGHIPGFAAPARGNRRWTGATPPFSCPVRARGCCATYICTTPPGGVAPVSLIPSGKATKDTRAGQDGTYECPRHPRETLGDPQEVGGGEAPRPPRLPLSGLRQSKLPARPRFGHRHEVRASRCQMPGVPGPAG